MCSGMIRVLVLGSGPTIGIRNNQKVHNEPVGITKLGL